jgi:hypothetical protein
MTKVNKDNDPRRAHISTYREVDSIQQLAVNIQLHLAKSTVPNAHRLAISVAGQVIEVDFIQFVFSADAVPIRRRDRSSGVSRKRVRRTKKKTHII